MLLNYRWDAPSATDLTIKFDDLTERDTKKLLKHWHHVTSPIDLAMEFDDLTEFGSFVLGKINW